MNRRRSTPVLVVALWMIAAAAPPAVAERFYTFDPGIDALVEIDTATGVATDLGFIGGAVTAASGQGVAVEYDAGVIEWTGFTLGDLTLQRATVSPIAYQGSTPWAGGSPAAAQVGGMARDGSTLLVSYSPCCGLVRYVAELSAAGVLSNTTDYSAFTVRLDLLAQSQGGGTLLAVQNFPSATPPAGRLYRLGRPVASVDVLGDIPYSTAHAERTYTGLDFTDSGDLWLLERTAFLGWTMRRIDPANGAVLADVPLTYATTRTSVAFTGLAHIGSPPVPAGTTTWGRIKSAYR